MAQLAEPTRMEELAAKWLGVTWTDADIIPNVLIEGYRDHLEKLDNASRIEALSLCTDNDGPDGTKAPALDGLLKSICSAFHQRIWKHLPSVSSRQSHAGWLFGRKLYHGTPVRPQIFDHHTACHYGWNGTTTNERNVQWSQTLRTALVHQVYRFPGTEAIKGMVPLHHSATVDLYIAGNERRNKLRTEPYWEYTRAYLGFVTRCTIETWVVLARMTGHVGNAWNWDCDWLLKYYLFISITDSLHDSLKPPGRPTIRSTLTERIAGRAWERLRAEIKKEQIRDMQNKQYRNNNRVWIQSQILKQLPYICEELIKYSTVACRHARLDSAVNAPQLLDSTWYDLVERSCPRWQDQTEAAWQNHWRGTPLMLPIGPNGTPKRTRATYNLRAQTFIGTKDEPIVHRENHGVRRSVLDHVVESLQPAFNETDLSIWEIVRPLHGARSMGTSRMSLSNLTTTQIPTKDKRSNKHKQILSKIYATNTALDPPPYTPPQSSRPSMQSNTNVQTAANYGSAQQTLANQTGFSFGDQSSIRPIGSMDDAKDPNDPSNGNTPPPPRPSWNGDGGGPNGNGPPNPGGPPDGQGPPDGNGPPYRGNNGPGDDRHQFDLLQSNVNEGYFDEQRSIHSQLTNSAKLFKNLPSDCTYHGTPRKDKPTDRGLIKIIIQWEGLNKIFSFPEIIHIQVWRLKILKGKARQFAEEEEDTYGNDIQVLWRLLLEHFEYQNDTDKVIKRVRTWPHGYTFTNGREYNRSFDRHMLQMKQEYDIIANMHAHRTNVILTSWIPDQDIYMLCFEGIHDRAIFRYLTELEQDAGCSKCDLKQLQDHILKAWSREKPAGRLQAVKAKLSNRSNHRPKSRQHYGSNSKYKSRKPSSRGNGRYRKNDRGHKKRGGSKTGPYHRRYKKRPSSRSYAQEPSSGFKLKGNLKCFACSGDHAVAKCRNYSRRKTWCQAQSKCLACCRSGHRIAECTDVASVTLFNSISNRGRGSSRRGRGRSRRSTTLVTRGGKTYRMTEITPEEDPSEDPEEDEVENSESGSVNQSEEEYSDPEEDEAHQFHQHAPSDNDSSSPYVVVNRWSDEEWESFDAENSDHEQSYAQTAKFVEIPKIDPEKAQIINALTQYNPRMDQYNFHAIFPPKKPQFDQKCEERMLVHYDRMDKTLHRVNQRNMSAQQAMHEGVIKSWFVKASGRKMITIKGLADTGSTLSTICPETAQHMKEACAKDCINIGTRKNKFTVETGGSKDAIYTGKWVELNIQRPGTKMDWVPIKFFVMPHEVKIPFDVIVGEKDLALLGIQLSCFDPEYYKMIFKHRNAVKTVDLDRDDLRWDQMAYIPPKKEVKRSNRNYEAHLSRMAYQRQHCFMLRNGSSHPVSLNKRFEALPRPLPRFEEVEASNKKKGKMSKENRILLSRERRQTLNRLLNQKAIRDLRNCGFDPENDPDQKQSDQDSEQDDSDHTMPDRNTNKRQRPHRYMSHSEREESATNCEIHRRTRNKLRQSERQAEHLRNQCKSLERQLRRKDDELEDLGETLQDVSEDLDRTVSSLQDQIQLHARYKQFTAICQPINGSRSQPISHTADCQNEQEVRIRKDMLCDEQETRLYKIINDLRLDTSHLFDQAEEEIKRHLERYRKSHDEINEIHPAECTEAHKERRHIGRSTFRNEGGH